mmetsp:Transcript_87207/g.247621  ORF Transcript_87207/g.247621 Transcript_87207/m.247621 type:complete len:242 (-) Transcript_87207:370-1095(-)
MPILSLEEVLVQHLLEQKVTQHLQVAALGVVPLTALRDHGLRWGAHSQPSAQPTRTITIVVLQEGPQLFPEPHDDRPGLECGCHGLLYARSMDLLGPFKILMHAHHLRKRPYLLGLEVHARRLAYRLHEHLQPLDRALLHHKQRKKQHTGALDALAGNVEGGRGRLAGQFRGGSVHARIAAATGGLDHGLQGRNINNTLDPLLFRRALQLVGGPRGLLAFARAEDHRAALRAHAQLYRRRL